MNKKSFSMQDIMLISLDIGMEKQLLAILEEEKRFFGKEAYYREQFIGDLESGKTIYLIYDCANTQELLGYFYPNIIEEEKLVEIHKLLIFSLYQNQGIAKKVFQYFLSQCLHSGDFSFYIEVRKNNDAAKKLYESIGLSQIGIRKNYYKDPPDHALIYKGRINRKEM